MSSLSAAEADKLVGGGGNDILEGGEGRDVFVIMAAAMAMT